MIFYVWYQIDILSKWQDLKCNLKFFSIMHTIIVYSVENVN
jgi:hypothetical protein